MSSHMVGGVRMMPIPECYYIGSDSLHPMRFHVFDYVWIFSGTFMIAYGAAVMVAAAGAGR